MYYIITYRVSLLSEQSPKFQPPKLHKASRPQIENIVDIANRSSFLKVTKEQLANSFSVSSPAPTSRKDFKIHLPSSALVRKLPDLKSVEGRILYYNRDQRGLMFGLTLGTFLTLYESD
jgi:hypothetical protein